MTNLEKIRRELMDQTITKDTKLYETCIGYNQDSMKAFQHFINKTFNIDAKFGFNDTVEKILNDIIDEEVTDHPLIFKINGQIYKVNTSGIIKKND